MVLNRIDLCTHTHTHTHIPTHIQEHLTMSRDSFALLKVGLSLTSICVEVRNVAKHVIKHRTASVPKCSFPVRNVDGAEVGGSQSKRMELERF